MTYCLSPHAPIRQTLPIVALAVGLCVLSAARASLHGFDDAARAMSYFVRTRRGPAVSMLRLDQEIKLTEESIHVLARTRRY